MWNRGDTHEVCVLKRHRERHGMMMAAVCCVSKWKQEFINWDFLKTVSGCFLQLWSKCEGGHQQAWCWISTLGSGNVTPPKLTEIHLSSWGILGFLEISLLICPRIFTGSSRTWLLVTICTMAIMGDLGTNSQNLFEHYQSA